MNELLSQVHSLVNSGMDMAVGMGAPDLILAGIFYALAGVAVLSAFGVVLCRNIVHSALLLAASFIGLGCLYIYLGADFMGAVQFLVYGGAVAILIVMVIMLTRRDSRDHFSPFRSLLHQVGAAAIAGGFLLTMALAVLLSPFQEAPAELGDSVAGLADLMLTKYVLPFEVAAILLLVAMIGAIILAKGADEA